jgi:hypothetical protein
LQSFWPANAAAHSQLGLTLIQTGRVDDRIVHLESR